MKILLSILSAAVLCGCAYAPQRPNGYANRMPPPGDPSQWHVVSVTPVAPGTGERLAATSGKGGAEPGSPVLYRSDVEVSAQPAYIAPPMYAQQPMYVQQPVYVAQPVYAAPAPYYYPPVSIGFDFMFGRSWGGHRGGRNWAGVGVGTGWRR